MHTYILQVDGTVDPHKLPVLSHWNRSCSIESILVEIRRYAYLSMFSFSTHRRASMSLYVLGPTADLFSQGNGLSQQPEAPPAT